MGKGGSSTSVEIPAYIEDAAKKNLTRADQNKRNRIGAAVIRPHGSCVYAHAAIFIC